MQHDITCDLDRFGAALESLLADIPEACGDALEKSVRHSVRKTASQLRGELTAGIGIHDWSDEYRSGFSSRVEGDKVSTVGTVGNKNKPGLVHLLEKGHATLTGRRTRAFPHMEPAFQEMETDFIEDAQKRIAEAVR